MKPFLKFGLIVGVLGFIAIIPVSAVMGLCGPGVTLVAGAIAGFLSAYNGQALSRRDGAQSGAMAGAITGAITFIGQLLGGILVLVFIQVSGTPVAFGRIPTIASPAYEHIIYYASGLGVGVCFGVIGIIMGAVAGGITGAFGTREAPIPVVPAGTADGA